MRQDSGVPDVPAAALPAAAFFAAALAAVVRLERGVVVTVGVAAGCSVAAFSVVFSAVLLAAFFAVFAGALVAGLVAAFFAVLLAALAAAWPLTRTRIGPSSGVSR